MTHGDERIDPPDTASAGGETASATPARWIGASDAASFVVNVLLDPARKVPVVGITTHRHSDAPTIDPVELAGSLGGNAEVVALRTGEATWALSEALPSRLDVFDGAARIWWPGLTITSEPYAHPLMFIYNSRDAEFVARRIVAAICRGDARAGRFGTWSPASPAAPTEPPAPPEPERGGVPAAPPASQTRAGKPIHNATVVAIDGTEIRVRVGSQEGVLGFADEKLDALAARLRVGQTVPVFLAGSKPDGTPRFSTQGLQGPGATPRVETQRADVPLAPVANPVLNAVVTKIEGALIHIDVSGDHGVLVDADVPLERLAADLSTGETLRVRRATATAVHGLLSKPLRALGELLSGAKAPTGFSTRGLQPDPWRRLAAVYNVGDIVHGRVCKIADRYALVELLPGAAVLVALRELDWSFVKHPSDVLRVGERVKVKLLDLDPARRRGNASIKQAYVGEARPLITPGPGQSPFLADGDEAVAATGGGDDGELAERIEQLQQELESTLGDRAALMERLRGANDQVAELRKELRSTEDRLRSLEQRASGDLDPKSSESAFLTAVRVEYARRFAS